MDQLNFNGLDRGFWVLVAVVTAILALQLLFLVVAFLLPGVILKACWCFAFAYVICWLVRVVV